MKDEYKHEEGNLDPVCGMTVTKKNAACSYDHKGKTGIVPELSVAKRPEFV